MTTRIIAIANQKGGVGKTTTVVNLGAGLAAAGFVTLAVDLDAQGQISKYFDLEPRATVYDVLVNGLPAASAICQVRPRLFVLPSAKSLAEAKEVLTSRRRREELLLQALKPVAAEYDFILLDCAPSLDVLNINALVAADEIILPVSCDYLALDGARAHLATVEEMKQEGYSIGVRAILPTFYDSRDRKSRQAVSLLSQHYNGVVSAPIRKNVRVSEAAGHHKTIFEYAPQSIGAEDYARLTDSVAHP
ncbi:MAG: ParA family protein [Dehalococcoidia bacterium]